MPQIVKVIRLLVRKENMDSPRNNMSEDKELGDSLFSEILFSKYKNNAAPTARNNTTNNLTITRQYSLVISIHIIAARSKHITL